MVGTEGACSARSWAWRKLPPRRPWRAWRCGWRQGWARPARRCAASAWPASPLALWRSPAAARSMAAGANDMHGVTRDASLSLRHRGRVHRPPLRRQPASSVPRRARPLRCRHAVAGGGVQPERDHLRPAAGRPRQHGARPHLHAQVGTALRRPPQRGHRLGAGTRRARPRRRAAVRGDRRAGRGAGGSERGGRADGRDHRRAAAPVARAGDAGGDGRGARGDRARRRGGRRRIARCWRRSATRSLSRR